ncbi:MAG TPA: hypothetical protein VM533_16900 [Fimbriiglobus sp.]|jgi:hypothetical protein|nr:hypothetical protein [Fimbriiglobus sp.]
MPLQASGGRKPPEDAANDGHSNSLGGLTPPARLVAWSLVAATAFFLFAHGCHGPDDDHEPAVAPVSRD